MSLIYMTPATETFVAGSSSEAPRRRRNCLYLGAKADAKNREKLERWGITHILNVTPSKEASIQSGIPNYFEKSGNFVYKRIPVYDAATSNLMEFAEEIIVNFISTGLCHGSVLVHCQRGVSRSAACVLFYLMSKVSMTLDQALKLVRRRRPDVEPIPAFMAQLQSYEDRCRSLGLLKDDDEPVDVHCKRGRDSDNLPKCKDVESTEVEPDQNNKKRDELLSQPSVKRSVGPSLPPPGSFDTSSSKPRMIGPSRPPSSNSGVKKARIGPNPE